MKSPVYIVDRSLHWLSAVFLIFMLMTLSSQLHNMDWDIKGQLEHRQDAVEMHALVGILLIAVTVFRLLVPYVSKQKIPRITPRSQRHKWFIAVTHAALYLCILLLGVTGLALINNYEIPLTVMGVELAPDRDMFYEVFPKFHDIHMLAKQTIWWLIGIHFVGIIYAKR